ncbi:hypothetical protein [Nocardioides sp. YIM 152315]|uniref:hypothetical protein n=1 Tax=Nocardioides sp. YIM 152315 TaxID=3031760 RepID=UPI0023DBE346|nr:hypothetical protein [Nocardioides sp. YIM 152315]MDF1603400.1 hypothetical protein [Nocardioides sp. YIM 152315]
MAKSVADLRAEKSAGRPRRPLKIIVGEGRKYEIELDRLTAEHDKRLAVAAATPRKTGSDGVPERVTEIRARMAELLQIIGEYEGEVIVEATRDDGDWAQWRIAHPARPQGEPGFREDAFIVGGWCNSDDLIADVARYVVSWESEPLGEGDFDALNVPRPVKKDIAKIVIDLYENGDDLGKSLSDLSAFLESVQSSSSPSESESARSESSDGNPPSDTSTSTPTGI